MRRIVVGLVFLVCNAMSHAAPIIYTVSQTLGDVKVDGYITTDGMIGTIGMEDLVDFGFVFSYPGGTSPSYVLTNPAVLNGQFNVSINGGPLSATTDSLIFMGAEGTSLTFFGASSERFPFYRLVNEDDQVDVSTGASAANSAVIYIQTLGEAKFQSPLILGVATPLVVPEPGSIPLLVAGMAILLVTGRKRQRIRNDGQFSQAGFQPV